MASINSAKNIMKRFGSSALRLTTDFALSTLMDQSTADTLSIMLGKGQYLRFIDEEIKLISKLFDSNVSRSFIPEIEFGKLKDKDAGSSLVSKIKIEDELKSKLNKFYDLVPGFPNDSSASGGRYGGVYYLVIRKCSKQAANANKDLPPILQFLEKAFQIQFEIVYNKVDNLEYSGYSNTTTIKKFPGIGDFVTFLNSTGQGNKILFNANAFLKQERMNTITSENYLNNNTVRNLLLELKKLINPRSSSSPFNLNSIRETNDDDSDFELLALFKQIHKTGRAKSENELNFISDTILEYVIKKFSQKKNNTVKLTIQIKRNFANFKFEHKVPSVAVKINPKLIVDLKTGECKFSYRNKENQLKSQIINSQKNDYKELFEKTLNETYKEAKANKEFVEFISNVLAKLLDLPKQAMSDFFNVNDRDIDVFELLDLFDQIKTSNKITSREPIKQLLPDILSAVRDQFKNSQSTASNSNTFISTKVNASIIKFTFNIRVIPTTFRPQNSLSIDLKSGKCLFVFRDTDNKIKAHSIEKYKTEFKQLFNRTLDGKFNESKSEQMFIKFILAVLHDIPQRAHDSLSSIF